ncbi:baseplate J/gp47 family protein [Halomonas organivorans]|uniref:Phage-related baseplate assembly protein n=1 Tax=Halomonas organivorans TaxID=257772 RepID=A0A7W5G5S5_9GAMM|nr:baseplate J/gp47 family protein [Halomonas organivorans]MBB3141212.1 phage-related baseplate assembly protein [Halomonas organivorans]
MTTPIDLSQLPAPDVIEALDYETLFTERKDRLLDLTPAEERDALAATLALESEPLTKLLQENAYRELILRQRINEAARAVMLAYAQDADLDQLGANYDVERLVIDPGDPDALPPVPPTLERDADYRARIQLAFESLSVAGPVGAYEFQARAAHADVLDVSVVSPEPVDVVVTVLARSGNGIPRPEVLEAVRTHIDERRPLTDRVTVQPASLAGYHIDASLILNPGPDGEVVISAARRRLDAYITDRHRLGAWVTRSGIDAALTVEGVVAVELSGWQELRAEPHQAPHCLDASITVGGRRQ